jgi:ferric-dicitrate binding protein FerR (iron transport regulator)
VRDHSSFNPGVGGPLSADLLDRYLANQASSAERELVHAWIAQSEKNSAVVEQLRSMWPGRHHVQGVPDLEAAILRLMAAGPERGLSVRHTTRGFGARPVPPDARLSSRKVWGQFVGVVLATIAVAVIWFAVSTSRPGVVPPSKVYATGVGERAHVTLPDGNTLTLNVASRLVVPGDYRSGNRTVYLNGEALFDVPHHERSPLVVVAGSTATRVLGTTFDVRHYGGDADVRVVVVSGKVSVGAQRYVPVTLAAGSMGTVRDSTVTATPLSTTDSYTSWTKGKLEFRRTPVKEVLATLERWYGIRFRLTDSSLTSDTVTAALDYGSTTELVSALETILGVSATFEMTPQGKTITLAPRKSARVPTRPEMLQKLSFPTTEVGR